MAAQLALTPVGQIAQVRGRGAVFAGPRLDQLLVTTISRSVPEGDPLAGRLVEVGTRRGHPLARAAVGPIEVEKAGTST